MSRDFVIEQHKEWLGLLQSASSGLVVAPVALKEAQLQIDKNVFELSCKLRGILNKDGLLPFGKYQNLLTDFLDWPEESLAKGLEADALVLPEYNETIEPTLRVSNAESLVGFVSFLPDGQEFDEDSVVPNVKWIASHQDKFERLLRDKDVSIGVLVSNSGLRLTYAPRQETSGYITFPFSVLGTYDGRIALSAFYKLLNSWCLFHAPEKSRLKHILEESRRYQNTVSIELSSQVLSALYELVRGFDHAHQLSGKALLKESIDSDPNQIYKGLLTVLLRVVFLLYAEDRDILFNSKGETRRQAAAAFKNYYSINSLFEQLRADSAVHLDTMDHRYGAWARLVSLFRTVYEGLEYEDFKLLGRKGHLFEPDRFPFLEGRTSGQSEIKPPLITDGTVFRVLSYLMTLEGERISYKALDVEQIGSVYETVMGFKLELATGPSIAIRPKKPHGAPVVVNLEVLLGLAGKDRTKWLKEHTDQDEKSEAFKSADSVEALVSALERKIARRATPSVSPKGSLVLQPSTERRKTGSHYTPRSLTEPIVRSAFEPILSRLGQNPSPEQILELKVCDPAMGSGAFLVESCRQLAEALVRAWTLHNTKLDIPPDETELVYARRLVARECIYGVDKNPMATDLAKLSLWLATFATDHQFTFLDDKLKCGDSLVGLSINQLTNATWEPDVQQGGLFATPIQSVIEEYQAVREEIAHTAEDHDYGWLSTLNHEAEALSLRIKRVGDMIVSSFFEGSSAKIRKQNLSLTATKIPSLLVEGDETSPDLPNGLSSFHWPVEFPEVFFRENSGFDSIVGNPPFLGGAKIWPTLGPNYPDWLRNLHPKSNGKAVDLVAHFLRRAYHLVRSGGTIGLVTTKTIYQGDTRTAGILEVLNAGAQLYSVRKRVRWPGEAAVIVSLIHVSKEKLLGPILLDGKKVKGINSFFVDSTIEYAPRKLRQNKNRCFRGCDIYGLGFLFTDAEAKTKAGSIEEMNGLLVNPSNRDVIWPYIGGDEVTSHPSHECHRYAINFRDMSLEEAGRWPELLALVERFVKPERDALGGYSVAERRREYWWQYGTYTPALYKAIMDSSHVIALSQTTKYIAFAILPARMVFSHKLIIFKQTSGMRDFAVLQSRVHELWALFFGSTQGDTPVYSTVDCFETFPFPAGFELDENLEVVATEYLAFRAEILRTKNIGLTDLYNLVHDQAENDAQIFRMRELQSAIDRAVLNAYGWRDIETTCEFLADYDDDEGDSQYRLKWPDDTRDLVLGRLMELNAQYAAEEAAQEGADES